MTLSFLSRAGPSLVGARTERVSGDLIALAAFEVR
jgi:hypothetical protein